MWWGELTAWARSPRHIPSLAAQLLADTWVVRSLDDALRLQKELGADYRFVTLQGELVEKDRTLFTGNVRSETAVVSRKSELRRLKTEFSRIEHLISERDLRLQDLVASIESADGELQNSRDNVERCAVEHRTEMEKLAQVQQNLSASQTHESKLAEELQTLTDRIDGLQTEISGEEEKQAATEAEIAALQQEIQEAERILAEDRQQLQILEKSRTESHLELTRSEERLHGIKDAVQRLDEDLQQRRLQQQEASRRLNGGVKRSAELQLSRLNVAAEIAELRIHDDNLTTDIRERGDVRGLLRNKRSEATAAEQQAREICREHEQRFHEVELKISGIDHQLETAAERIQDEFQISVEEAVEDGRSGIAAWLTMEAEEDRDRRNARNTDDSNTSDDEEGEQAYSNDDPFTDEEDIAVHIDDPQVQQILRDDERYDEMRETIDQQTGKLRRKLKKIGNVGTESLDNLNELETRFDRLHSQLKDLEAARDTLRDMVRQINQESRRMFEESFACIRDHFRDLFRRLFGGGEADVYSGRSRRRTGMCD